MAEVRELIEAGKQMGMEGDVLQQFVEHQQEKESKRREQEQNMEIEKMKMAEEFQEQRLRLEATLKKDILTLEKEIEQLKLKSVTKQKIIDDMKMNTERDAKEVESAIWRNRALYDLQIPMYHNDYQMALHLNRFEFVAIRKHWDYCTWPIQLCITLTGQALEIFCSLSEEEQENFESVKQALLEKHRVDEMKVEQAYSNVGDVVAEEITCKHNCDSKLDTSHDPKSGRGNLGHTFENNGINEDLRGHTEVSYSYGHQADAQCSVCKKNGHTQDTCWFRNQVPGRKSCFTCGSTEHLKKHCQEQHKQDDCAPTRHIGSLTQPVGSTESLSLIHI